MEANWPEEFTTKEFRHAKHTKSRIENHVAGRFYNGKDAKQVCRNAGYLGEWIAIWFGCSPKNRLELSRIAVALRKRTASIISDASLNRIISEMLVLKLICMSSLLYERFIGSASVKSERFTNVTSTWHDAPGDKLGSRVMRALFVGEIRASCDRNSKSTYGRGLPLVVKPRNDFAFLSSDRDRKARLRVFSLFTGHYELSTLAFHISSVFFGVHCLTI